MKFLKKIKKNKKYQILIFSILIVLSVIIYLLILRSINIKNKMQENFLPNFYINYNKMNISEYDKYEFPYNREILINNTIVENKVKSKYQSNVKQFYIGDINIRYIDTSIINSKDYKKVSKDNSKFIVSLPNEVKNGLIFIKIKFNNSIICEKNSTIEINGDLRKITCDNDEFEFILKDESGKLNFIFSKGFFSYNIKYYYIDSKNLKKDYSNINELKYSLNNNKIIIKTDSKKDGNLVTNLKYDKRYKIKIDSKKIKYNKINKDKLGFDISSGKHEIVIKHNLIFIKILLGVLILIADAFIIFIIEKKLLM